jgi:hypothetical protein
MNGFLRADHVAGLILVSAGFLVFALSGDLPFGSLAFPGAGFLPKVLATSVIGLGVLLALGAAQSALFRTLPWGDLKHAGAVFGIAAAATALYSRLGFVLTLTLMMFVLLVVVERKGVAPAAAYSLTIVVLSYFLFTALRAPIPIGPFGF